MALAKPPVSSPSLTYEQYLTEGEIEQPYEIINGARIIMPGPRWRHQRISYNTVELLRSYERAIGIGLALSAPFDVLIRCEPLQVRQPDVLFITNERLEQGGGIECESDLGQFVPGVEVWANPCVEEPPMSDPPERAALVDALTEL